MSLWNKNKKENFIKKKTLDNNFFDLIGSLNWVEIPVSDLNRAVNFYKKVFKCDFSLHSFNNQDFAFFNSKSNSIKGTLVQKSESISNRGPSLYFNVDTQLSSILKKIEINGGQITQPKTLLKNAIDDKLSVIAVNSIDGKIGYLTKVQDSEGNSLMLYSNS